MVLRDGKKYACDSCIRGHRVSGCTHTDRELQYIAPKGRPVKQCDHCRGARKSKSHHAKCDCGGRHERNEIKPDDDSCCCMLGDSCICGLKNGSDPRHDAGHARAIHGRPHIPKNASEGHITTHINSQHKAVHKWEKGEGLGAPYPSRKTANDGSHCSTPVNAGSQQHASHPFRIPERQSKDDSALSSPSSIMYSNGQGQISVDNLPLAAFSVGSVFNPTFSKTQPQHFPGLTSPERQEGKNFSLADPSNDKLLNELFRTSNPSPGHNSHFLSAGPDTASFQASQENLFTSASLPLALPLTAPQAISNSDESLIGPELTANSSTTPSERGDVYPFTDAGAESQYDMTSVLTSPTDVSPFGFDQPNSPRKQKANQIPTSNPNGLGLQNPGLSQLPPSHMQFEPQFSASNAGNMSVQNIGYGATISPVRKMPPSLMPNTSGSGRRSLDASTMRHLSTHPDLDEFLNQPHYVNNNTAISNVNPAFQGSQSMSYDTQDMSASNRLLFELSGNFIARNQPSTVEFNNRPRSMPLGSGLNNDLDSNSYNLNGAMHNMYTELDQDFTTAASWAASGSGYENWMPQQQLYPRR